MLQLTPPIMVIGGIALMVMAFIFYARLHKYSKFWNVIFAICALYSSLLGFITVMAGILSIFAAKLVEELLGDKFSCFALWSAAILVIIWWIPWFKKHWKQVIRDAKKNGYI